MKIVFASHSHMNGDYVVGSHHLARQFAKQGHQVLHLSTPITPFHIWRYSDKQVRARYDVARYGCMKRSPRLHECVPISIIPGSADVLVGGSMNMMLRSIVAPLHTYRNIFPFKSVDAVVIDQPYFYNIWKYIESDKVVYRPTDIYPKTTGYNRIQSKERIILEKADAVVATSEPVADHIRRLRSRRLPIHVMPNGVEVDHFAERRSAPSEYINLNHPIVVYVGALDERFDWNAVIHAAKELPSTSFVLIGPNTTPPGRKTPPNIIELGARDYDSIPAFIQNADVGIIPLNDHPGNDSRSPMKMYEYMASGIPVVSRKTESIKDDQSGCLKVYFNYEQMVEAIQAATNDSREKRYQLKMRQLAQRHSWETKSKKLLSIIKGGEVV